jgi:hypothetical protein
VTRPPRRWLSGFGLRDWGADAQTYASLLDALTRDRVETEVLEREMSAPAAAHDATNVSQLERHELEDARRELDTFRAALDDVRRRAAGNPRAEVPYDSANHAEDAVADVLIQYLVRPGYAEVRTEERGPGHYIYYIRVDWPKLRALAVEQGHALPE